MIHGRLRSKTTLILPLLILSLIAASADGGSASSNQEGNEGSSMPDMPDVAPPKVGDPPGVAELEDLRTIASQKGVSLQAAIDRYAWNDNFALAVAEVRESFPEDFAGAEIVDADNAWIAFKAGVPKAALEMVSVFTDSQTRISVDVRSNMGFSEIELQKAIVAAHYAVFERPEVRDAVTSHDYATGEITTVVVLEDTISDSALDELRIVAEESLVAATRNDILDSLAVSLVRSPHPTVGVDFSSTEHLGE